MLLYRIHTLYTFSLHFQILTKSGLHEFLPFDLPELNYVDGASHLAQKNPLFGHIVDHLDLY